MNIVICEDEEFWIDELKRAIGDWAEAKNINVSFNSFTSPEQLLKYFEHNSNVDVLFFDISLGHSYFDGIKLANHIRKMGILTPIIFVTVDSYRATDGYLVDAMGFLVKPIDKRRLIFFLDKILKKQQNQKYINLIRDGSVVNISLDDIVYIEIIDHTVKIHKIQDTITHRGTLKEITSMLDDESFTQIHRSYIISLDKVDYIKTSYPFSVYIIRNAEKINLPISRKYIKNLLGMYSDKLLEKLI